MWSLSMAQPSALPRLLVTMKHEALGIVKVLLYGFVAFVVSEPRSGGWASKTFAARSPSLSTRVNRF